MGLMGHRNTAAGASSPAEIATQGLAASDGGKWAALLSAVALAFSGYSLWETSLKSADVRVFVPPVIQYSSPYQNSNFEVVAVPVTMTNEGARTATILSMTLEVTDPKSGTTKRFYAADFGRWTMEKARSGAFEPFAPVSLSGRSSRTEQVLFYPKGEAEKPNQMIAREDAYQFKLSLEQAEEPGLIPGLTSEAPAVSFTRKLRFLDHRSFENGTIPMDSPDWTSAKSGG